MNMFDMRFPAAPTRGSAGSSVLRFDYPCAVSTTPDGGYVVRFPDVPEASAVGTDRADALTMARYTLTAALGERLMRLKPLPTPSPASSANERMTFSLTLAASPRPPHEGGGR